MIMSQQNAEKIEIRQSDQEICVKSTNINNQGHRQEDLVIGKDLKSSSSSVQLSSVCGKCGNITDEDFQHTKMQVM